LVDEEAESKEDDGPPDDLVEDGAGVVSGDFDVFEGECHGGS
jgi:hypothetical protein